MRRALVLVLAMLAALAVVPAALGATFTVTNTSNSGPGSLRQAILDANANPGADTIDFNIPGAGVHTITPTSLPTITGPTAIDGYTQPGASPNALAVGNDAVLLIELNGAAGGLGASGLVIGGTGNTSVRGLVINGWGQFGLFIQTAAPVTISGNFIGTNPAGSAGTANVVGGVRFQGPSAGGIVGSAVPADRNLISGNGSQGGISFTGSAVTNTAIQGNYIGTDRSGTAAIPNAFGISAPFASTLVGGPGAAGNLISGNTTIGAIVTGGGSVVEGNYIGTDATGTVALGNGGTGLSVRNGNTVTDNVVSGNGFSAAFAGILLNVGGGEDVQNNLIGTDATGNGSIPNAGPGVAMFGTGHLLRFNTIANNGGNGVLVTATAGSGNTITENSIHSNGLLGIDVGADGVSANDPNDPDTGPNDRQNSPVVTSAFAGANTTVNGTLNSTPSTQFVLELFANSSCDTSTYGEGETLLGAVVVTTDAGGNASFSDTFGVATSAGAAITGTATAPNGSTSEFSQCAFATVADSDGDTVLDDDDNCPNDPNPDQANSDDDALGNACDPDDDNDGVADAGDNCPTTANAGQADSDFDGIGDACDPQFDSNTCKTTGGGRIAAGSFAFTAQVDKKGAKGNLEYTDAATGKKLKGNVAGVACNGATASFAGTGTYDGRAVTFTVTVKDGGEPGSSDTLAITWSGTNSYAAAGALTAGNLQVHK